MQKLIIDVKRQVVWDEKDDESPTVYENKNKEKVVIFFLFLIICIDTLKSIIGSKRKVLQDGRVNKSLTGNPILRKDYLLLFLIICIDTLKSIIGIKRQVGQCEKVISLWKVIKRRRKILNKIFIKKWPVWEMKESQHNERCKEISLILL